ncbi:MAG: hypothetical protein KC684_01920, partial [Candidatus Omnitrophica bacterium]|nr:hypothetical protein [Candidatus Omnitrophota bacterium]
KDLQKYGKKYGAKIPSDIKLVFYYKNSLPRNLPKDYPLDIFSDDPKKVYLSYDIREDPATISFWIIIMQNCLCQALAKAFNEPLSVTIERFYRTGLESIEEVGAGFYIEGAVIRDILLSAAFTDDMDLMLMKKAVSNVTILLKEDGLAHAHYGPQKSNKYRVVTLAEFLADGKLYKKYKVGAQHSAEKIREDIRMIVAEILEVDLDSVEDDAYFVEDLGMDSMQTLELLAAIEKKYHIQIMEKFLTYFINLDETVSVVLEILGFSQNDDNTFGNEKLVIVPLAGIFWHMLTNSAFAAQQPNAPPVLDISNVFAAVFLAFLVVFLSSYYLISKNNLSKENDVKKVFSAASDTHPLKISSLNKKPRVLSLRVVLSMIVSIAILFFLVITYIPETFIHEIIPFSLPPVMRVVTANMLVGFIVFNVYGDIFGQILNLRKEGIKSSDIVAKIEWLKPLVLIPVFMTLFFGWFWPWAYSLWVNSSLPRPLYGFADQPFTSVISLFVTFSAYAVFEYLTKKGKEEVSFKYIYKNKLLDYRQALMVGFPFWTISLGIVFSLPFSFATQNILTSVDEPFFSIYLFFLANKKVKQDQPVSIRWWAKLLLLPTLVHNLYFVPSNPTIMGALIGSSLHALILYFGFKKLRKNYKNTSFISDVVSKFLSVWCMTKNKLMSVLLTGILVSFLSGPAFAEVGHPRIQGNNQQDDQKYFEFLLHNERLVSENIIIFTTSDAHYLLHMGNHQKKTEIPENLAEIVDAFVLEDAGHFDDITLKRIAEKKQYKDILFLAKKRNKPVFFADLPVRNVDMYILFHLSFYVVLVFIAIYLGRRNIRRIKNGQQTNILEMMAFISILLALVAANVNVINFRPFNKASSCMVSITSFYLPNERRSAVVSWKILKYIVPELEKKLGRKPVIFVDYGRLHVTIKFYLENPSWTKFVYSFPVFNFLFLMEYENKVLEARFDERKEVLEIKILENKL